PRSSFERRSSPLPYSFRSAADRMTSAQLPRRAAGGAGRYPAAAAVRALGAGATREVQARLVKLRVALAGPWLAPKRAANCREVMGREARRMGVTRASVYPTSPSLDRTRFRATRTTHHHHNSAPN